MSFGELMQISLGFHNEAPLKGILSITVIDLIKDKSVHSGEIYQSL